MLSALQPIYRFFFSSYPSFNAYITLYVSIVIHIFTLNSNPFFIT
jgi:hypothetical protein